MAYLIIRIYNLKNPAKPKYFYKNSAKTKYLYKLKRCVFKHTFNNYFRL